MKKRISESSSYKICKSCRTLIEKNNLTPEEFNQLKICKCQRLNNHTSHLNKYTIRRLNKKC